MLQFETTRQAFAYSPSLEAVPDLKRTAIRSTLKEQLKGIPVMVFNIKIWKWNETNKINIILRITLECRVEWVSYYLEGEVLSF